MIGFLMQEDAVLKNSKNVQKRSSLGDKKSMPLNITLLTALQKNLTIRLSYLNEVLM